MEPIKDEDAKIFCRIVNFVQDLFKVYGKKQHSLQLYNRLISNTKFTSKVAIDRHIEIFKKFTEENHECITCKDPSKLKLHNITYSDNINIKMKEIFRLSDSATTSKIFDHLIVIETLLFPTTQNKDVLKNSLIRKEKIESNPEKMCIENLMSNLESVIDPNSENPLAEIMKLSTNPVMLKSIQEIVGNLTSGKLDPSTFLTTAMNTTKDMANKHQTGKKDISKITVTETTIVTPDDEKS